MKNLDFNSIGMQQIVIDLIDNKSRCNQKMRIRLIKKIINKINFRLNHKFLRETLYVK
ncbi:MAG: hypothetical protein AM1032_000335 [Mycoplasmataceae bacterium]|nr:MAG: hypothetical protein AM1032_000335 [Mycoplasmataceae bacterium]